MIDYTQEIKDILRDSSDLTKEEMDAVSNDTNIASLGIDSLALIEAIIEMERKFNIEIDIHGSWMEEVDVTVNQINKMINEKLNG